MFLYEWKGLLTVERAVGMEGSVALAPRHSRGCELGGDFRVHHLIREGHVFLSVGDCPTLADTMFVSISLVILLGYCRTISDSSMCI